MIVKPRNAPWTMDCEFSFHNAPRGQNMPRRDRHIHCLGCVARMVEVRGPVFGCPVCAVAVNVPVRVLQAATPGLQGGNARAAFAGANAGRPGVVIPPNPVPNVAGAPLPPPPLGAVAFPVAQPVAPAAVPAAVPVPGGNFPNPLPPVVVINVPPQAPANPAVAAPAAPPAAPPAGAVLPAIAPVQPLPVIPPVPPVRVAGFNWNNWVPNPIGWFRRPRIPLMEPSRHDIPQDVYLQGNYELVDILHAPHWSSSWLVWLIKWHFRFVMLIFLLNVVNYHQRIIDWMVEHEMSFQDPNFWYYKGITFIKAWIGGFLMVVWRFRYGIIRHFWWSWWAQASFIPEYLRGIPTRESFGRHHRDYAYENGYRSSAKHYIIPSIADALIREFSGATVRISTIDFIFSTAMLHADAAGVPIHTLHYTALHVYQVVEAMKLQRVAHIGNLPAALPAVRF